MGWNWKHDHLLLMYPRLLQKRLVRNLMPNLIRIHVHGAAISDLVIISATIHRCIILSLAISIFSYPESVSQEVERERRMTPDTERKLQGMTVNLQEAYYVLPCQHSFQLSHLI